MKKNSLHAVFLLCAILCAACNNFFAKPEIPAALSLPEGHGNVTISFTGEGSRTVFPSKLFDNYVYTFTKDDNGEELLKDPVDGGFTLEAGNWHVDIDAYVGEIDAANLAASGEADFQLAEDEFKRITVDFESIVTGGNGIFKYNIRYAPGTTVKSFTLKKLPEETGVNIGYTTGSGSLTGTVESVPAGFYLLNIQLVNDGLETGASEIVHIYRLLTSEYGTAAEPVVFGNSYFVPSPEGIYVGIISFANDVVDLTNGTPVLLNEAGRTGLIGLLNNSYGTATHDGSALFYGVHTAMVNMKNNEAVFPNKLDSVNIVTFTDGLDITSSGLAMLNPLEGKNDFVDDDEYGRYLSDEISKRRIADKHITAYSVGVRNESTDNNARFETTLRNIASAGVTSSSGRPYWSAINNMRELKSAFLTIAYDLILVDSDFVMTTSLLPAGTKVRMTFDYSPTSYASNKYIEGTIDRRALSGDGIYLALTDIVYKGITSAGTGPLVAAIDANNVATYTFENIIGFDSVFDRQLAKQWLMIPGTTQWTINSEYNNSGSAVKNRRSSAIYLVLDDSQSLSKTGITQVREAGIRFINTLYETYYGVTTKPLSPGRWTSETVTPTAPASRYSINVLQGATCYVWWNDSNDGNSTKTLNVKVSAEYENGISIFSNVDSGFSTAQSFTAATNGTVIITVTPYPDEDTGDYSITYNVSDNRPLL